MYLNSQTRLIASDCVDDLQIKLLLLFIPKILHIFFEQNLLSPSICHDESNVFERTHRNNKSKQFFIGKNISKDVVLLKICHASEKYLFLYREQIKQNVLLLKHIERM